MRAISVETMDEVMLSTGEFEDGLETRVYSRSSLLPVLRDVWVNKVKELYKDWLGKMAVLTDYEKPFRRAPTFL